MTTYDALLVAGRSELNSKIDAGLELISALGAVELKPIIMHSENIP